MFLLLESIKKTGLKTTKKSWKHYFPHHRKMGIFLDIQVQITPYYVVLSGRNSNSSKILCMSSIPTNSKWIGLIQREKKWKHQFFRRLRAANSVIRDRILNSSKLLCMSSLPVSMKRIPSTTTEKKWQQCFPNYNTICCHGNLWSDRGEYEKDQMKNSGENVMMSFSPL